MWGTGGEVAESAWHGSDHRGWRLWGWALEPKLATGMGPHQRCSFGLQRRKWIAQLLMLRQRTHYERLSIGARLHRSHHMGIIDHTTWATWVHLHTGYFVLGASPPRARMARRAPARPP